MPSELTPQEIEAIGVRRATFLTNTERYDAKNQAVIIAQTDIPALLDHITALTADASRNLQTLNLIGGIASNLLTQLGLDWKDRVAALCNVGGDYETIERDWKAAHEDATKGLQSVRAELSAAREVLARLPRTKDGKSLLRCEVGDAVFALDGKNIVRIPSGDWLLSPPTEFGGQESWAIITHGETEECYNLEGVYSTKEAAELAAKGKDGAK